MKKIATLISLLFFIAGLSAQTGVPSFWKDIHTEAAFALPGAKSYLPLASARVLTLDYEALTKYLAEAPMEFTEAARQQPLRLELPLPDGTEAVFGLYEIVLMEAGLAAAFPDIKTYHGNLEGKPEVFVRVTTGPLGFQATVFGGGVARLIEPVADGQPEIYASYRLSDAGNTGPVRCGNHDVETLVEDATVVSNDEEMVYGQKSLTPVPLKTYRLALATTAEYSLQNGNSVNAVLNAVTNVMNQVNGLMENDNAIRLILINNTTETFFFPPIDDDPYENGEAGVMLSQNPGVLNQAYGLDGYDVGHVFGTAPGGGVVGVGALASVCSDIKGRGASNVLNPANFYKTVVHEFGHQFSATHTFNFCDNENENRDTGYEPGGGSTLMAYAGACGSNSVQQIQDDYFHLNSLERILAFSTNAFSGGSCTTIIQTGNNTPEADIPMEGGFVIPVSTPFELSGAGSDAGGDALTYCWEEFDLGLLSPLGMPNGTAPLFRSYSPGTSPDRVFPKIQTIVANTSEIVEVLPTTTRPLTFRLTVRDNNAEAGGYAFDEIAFSSNAGAGPFLVTTPNAGNESWEEGQYVEVTWDVANTDGPAVNCQFVDIYLSKDGGYTYPIVLLENTRNDGSAFVVVPGVATDQARVKVKGRDNIFFDISNANFSITEATTPGFVISSYGPELGQVCLPGSFEVVLQTDSLLGFSDMITFSATGLPDGAEAVFTPNPVAPGEAVTLHIDMGNVTGGGLFTVVIEAVAPGVPPRQREVELNVVYNDFSALALNQPQGSAISTLPVYDWTDLPNALTYSIEVATDPDFNNIVDMADGLTDATYQSNVTLEENTVYFWRIAPSNECTTGGFSEIKAFKTISQACTTTSSSGTLDLPGGNGDKAESIINIPVGGQISDVNVKNITGDYNAFGDIVFRLKGPAATVVQLMGQQPCSSANAFNFGFDDQSAFDDIPCPPPLTGTAYRPINPLDVFNGTDAQGDWTLEIEVVTNFGSGGTLQSWDLEICGTSTPIDPQLVINDTICARPGTDVVLPPEKLEITDPDNTPAELTITILQNTSGGFISLNGVQLGTGESFTMQDLFNSAIRYTNTDAGATTDQFSFIVEDNTGGFLGLLTAVFEINTSCLTAAPERLLSKEALSVFPNPARGVLHISLTDEGAIMQQVDVFDARGRLITGRPIAGGVGEANLDVRGWTPGVYLVRVHTTSGVAAHRVLIY